MEPERSIAVGFDWSLPLMSRPTTCLHPGSNTATSLAMLQPGTTPGPPTSAAPTSDMMPSYRLGETTTSNCWGLDTCDLLSVVSQSKAECEFRNVPRLCTGDDLQRLDNAQHRLVF